MTKLMNVDLWGHNEQERNYGWKPEMPYEVDAPAEDPGTTYIRYLNRDITCIHKITVSVSGGREQTVCAVGYGAWADRATLSYNFCPADFPAIVDVPLATDPEPSGSVPDSESGSESGSATESESGSAPESSDETDSESAPESGSAPDSDSEGE